MAEFALGLTKMAVEGTVSRVKLAIEEEAKLRVRVENDLIFITGEFQMMQAFLKVANVKDGKNDVVRTWVRQVRDLAFDVEDCVEFVVHLDSKTAWDWLWRFGRMVVSCNAPPLPLDKAVADIKQIKARVEDVCQRNTRYNLIHDSAPNSKAVPREEKTALAITGTSALLREVWEATGKWCGMGNLEKLIRTEGSDLLVVSVWGSTGASDLGGTSILSSAYNDPGICHEFKARAWIKLMTPLNPVEFLKSLLTQVCTRSPEANGVDFRARMKAALDAEDDLMKAELMQQVMGEQRYFVILEEVSTVAEWEIIKMYLPDSKNGSRLVVSTKKLQTALSCIQKPYEVSELTRFSEQSLCAFSMKCGRHSGRCELIWQIRCRGVISVWGIGGLISDIVQNVYNSIMYKSKQFEGVEFERHSWVDVPAPFDLEVFSRRLLLDFRSQDLQVEEITAVGMIRDPGLTQECLKFLREEDCLVVINGLQSTDDWDLIKAAFLSKPIRGCIIVITNEESVATHCAEDGDEPLGIKDLEADPVLRSLIKGSQYYGIDGKEASRRGRFLSIRKEEAREWMNKFEYCWGRGITVNHPVTSVWGTDCEWKSDAVRDLYYERMLFSDGSVEKVYEEDRSSHQEEENKIAMYSWVDVPRPFSLTDFSCRLLLDFHSDDLRAKKTAGIGIMEGQDPIQGCHKILREYPYMVVIDGLQSSDDWDSIKTAFLSEPDKGCIIVITNEEHVARHIVSDEHDAFNAKDLEARTVVSPITKGCASRLFSNRSQEARDWTNTFKLIGRQAESAFHLGHSLQNFGVTSLWGIAGVGKTALVGSVYCHSMLNLQQCFQFGKDYGFALINVPKGITMHGWVDVRHPFDLTDFSCRLLLDFHSDDMQAKEALAVAIVEGQDPIQRCRRVLHEHKCFIVIDGLQSTEDWDMIKVALLQDISKACIIVITNEESIATHCVSNIENVINVKCLQADTALNLFKKVTWGHKELSREELELSEHTIAKCGGILKVIAALGEVLAQEIALYGDKFWDWSALPKILRSTTISDFLKTLESKPEFHSLRSLFAWVQSYFDACSDSLKPCIFYLSVFPTKCNVRRRRLLRRWIAEGYCRDTSVRVAEENGEMLFSELVDWSMIHQLEAKVQCQVNDFFHGYITSRPMEGSLVFALEEHCSVNSQRVGQHLTIRSSWDRDEIVFRGIDFSRLRSLTVFGEWKSFLISEKMLLLRVLDLEDASGIRNDDLDHIGKLQPRLKFLSLRGCKEISHLPESLCVMRQLQTLDVRGTSVVTLPQGITKLHKLQYIRAGASLQSDEANETVASLSIEDQSRTSTPQENVDDTSTVLEVVADEVRTSTTRNLVCNWLSKFRKCRVENGGVDVPAGIGNLTALHTLGVLNVNVAGGKAILKGIKKLTQLRKLGLSGINRKNWNEFCSVISGHAHLESLSVQVDKEDIILRFSGISQPPKALKSLKVNGQVQILPVWLTQLHDLKKGSFDLTILTQQDIEMFYTLPCEYSFGRVSIKPIEDDCELSVAHVGEVFYFLNYKVLEINCSTKLGVTFGEYIARNVELLKVDCSSGSSLRISGLDKLEKLKKVQLKGFYSNELKRDLQRQTDEHPNKPALKVEEPRLS